MSSARWERKKTRTRQALLDAALEIFSERGIYAPSIEEITDAADVGKGTFYQYFASREDLIAALVQQCFTAILDEAERAASSADRRDLARAVVEAHGRFFCDHPKHLLLLHQARGWMKLPKPKKSAIRTEFDRYIQALGLLLAPGLETLNVPARHRQRVALVVAGFIFGVLSFEYILGGGFSALPDLAGDGSVLTLLLRR